MGGFKFESYSGLLKSWVVYLNLLEESLQFWDILSQPLGCEGALWDLYEPYGWDWYNNGTGVIIMDLG